MKMILEQHEVFKQRYDGLSYEALVRKVEFSVLGKLPELIYKINNVKKEADQNMQLMMRSESRGMRMLYSMMTQ